MYIGVDIGGSKILVAASKNGRQLLTQSRMPTPDNSTEGVSEIKQLIEEVAKGETISAIGVAAPGPLDLQQGLILKPFNLGWNTPIVDQLKKRFKVPTVLVNDANAGALAETKLGVAQEHKSVLYLTISTGIGTGVIADGKIFHGAFDTEGGHITLDPDGPICSCGGRGHFEALVSGRAIKQHYGKPAYDIKDPKVWDQIARNMALGLASLAAITSPEVIVLGGGVSVHWDHFQAPLNKYFEQFSSRLYPLPKIVQAQFIEDGAVHGALLLAKEAAKGK